MSASAGRVAYEVDDGVPATVRIIPSEPVPETSANGIPTAMMYVSGDTGILNLGIRWWPAESELAAIRQSLAAALEHSPADFVITPDAFVVTAVTLLFSTGSGSSPIELARTKSSGVPPFTALFSISVQDHLDELQRACMGEPGLLFVEVEAELTRGRSATTTLAADVGPWAAALATAAGDELVAQVDALVATGAVHRTRSAVPDADTAGADLLAEADRMAAERFAGALGPPGSGATTVRAAATARRPEHTTLVRRADVGTWLRSSPGRHLIVVGGGGSEQPAGPAATTTPQRRVGLGFAADQAPVATIELAGSGEHTMLRPPFAEVTVAADDELAVTTRYLGGGASYRVTLPLEDDGWSLSPADLGLTEVSIDASRLHAAGATAVQAQVFYQPEDRGTPERRTVQFAGDTWQARWFVVSRGRDLTGRLLVNLTVTPDNLADVRRSTQSSTATVRL